MAKAQLLQPADLYRRHHPHTGQRERDPACALPGWGLVTFAVEVLNQHDQVVQRGTWNVLVRSCEV